MPIQNTFYLFIESNIKLYAPNKTGVYGLYDSSKNVIYYGKSDDDIRDRLLSHYRGTEGTCTQNATYFNCESNPYPRTRETELLEEYKRTTGSLPKCNDKI
jgi:excinuclease UvrABC nuclease subunit